MSKLPKWAEEAIAGIEYVGGDPDWTAKYQDGMEAGIRLVLNQLKRTSWNDLRLYQERNLEWAAGFNDGRQSVRDEVLGEDGGVQDE